MDLRSMMGTNVREVCHVERPRAPTFSQSRIPADFDNSSILCFAGELSIEVRSDSSVEGLAFVFGFYGLYRGGIGTGV